jgi:mono/diheme cytochrome c family protein
MGFDRNRLKWGGMLTTQTAVLDCGSRGQSLQTCKTIEKDACSTRMLMYRILMLCLSLLLAHPAPAADEPTIRFSVADRPVKTLNLTQLRARLAARDIELFDPHYKKRKRFRAFALADVMDAGFGKAWRSDDYREVVFVASDGYRAVSDRDKLTEQGGYVAFADVDAEAGWEPIERKRTNPGPFYVVWLGPKQGTAQAYPWPWQLAEISIVRFQDQYPAVYPAGAAQDASVMRGYDLFKDRCFRCHAMDEQGGTIGPDLNAPMSVTEYRSPMMIREFIRHPSRYRYTQMPDHEDLSERDLDDLLAYFRHQARRDRSSEPIP